MSKADRERWDERYEDEKWKAMMKQPYPLVQATVRPVEQGLALDVACGLGQNTLWLARQGYHAIGIDVSRVALEHAQATARQAGLDDRVLFAQADLDRYRPPAGMFDLIIVIRYLNRALFPALIDALKPGGLLIYATLNWLRAETHPDAPREYLLNPGELSTAFAALEILHDEQIGDHSELVARKPFAPCE